MRLFNLIKFLKFGVWLALGSAISAGAGLVPGQLQCEYRTNPRGIDTVAPRLTWQLQATDPQTRGQVQSAYRILVASSESRLRKDQGDLWDSGRVSSDESLNLTYGGKPLTSGTQGYWKVMVWDGQGQASAWSAPAEWSIGLLHPGDWHGDWIGWDVGGRTNDFSGAQWIWYPEGNPAEKAPVATRYFRAQYVLPATAIVTNAVISITADDQFELWVNGQAAGQGDGWGNPQRFDLASRLHAGTNILAVKARNVGAEPNPAGLLAKLPLALADGGQLLWQTDGTWKCATNAAAGWFAGNFDDSAWPAVMVVGPYASAAWGIIENGDRRLPARYLRREFTLDKKVRRATAYLCGLGLSELYLNGKKVGADVLSPALSEYEQRAFYVTYDVTAELQRGRNALGVILGNGRFYTPRPPRSDMHFFGYPKMRLQLNLEYTDGTVDQVISDRQWKVTTNGPILANNEYDGEVYDARREMAGWHEPGFNDADWSPAQKVTPGAPVLSAQIGEPIRVMDTLTPVAVTEPKPGTFIFDLGQNIAGWCRLQVRGPAGTTVQLRHAEKLQADGTLFTNNLRSALATDIYTLAGRGNERYEPSLTYHGFRYVEVTGYPGRPGREAIAGRVVRDAVPVAGDFAVSNAVLSQIYHNLYWTTLDNYRSMPTDLPRDERQGWLGDRQEVSKGETYLFQVQPLYAQWLRDIQDAQRADGSVSDVSPSYWQLYQDGTVWASTYIIIPHMLYDQYGDVGILRDHYASMKRWTDHMAAFLADGLMPRNTYEDWCFPPKAAEDMRSINSRDPQLTTGGVLMSTAIFYHDLQLLAKSAALLGHPEDAQRFNTLAGQVKTAFHRRFYHADTGYYDNGTQTSCVLPLAFDMVPAECRASVFAQLVKSITVENDNHLRTGLIGGHYLLRVLSDNGRPDLAYTLATQTTYPSWGYMARQGATTMWELWNGDTADAWMNSCNIVMLIGDLNIWLHEYLGGIRCAPGGPGFKHILIQPEPVGDLTWCRDRFDSPYGPIQTEWHHSADTFDLQVVVPVNTTAEIRLPAAPDATIWESGRPVAQALGLTRVRQTDNQACYQVGSGTYHFWVSP